MAKILVIEDELSIRELINELLTLAEYEVIEAENGSQGIELALTTLPDLILCDIMMPYKNGYEVLQQLQSYPETESIPFIFLTAKGTKVDFREGMSLGADDYLAKPFSEDDLLQAINTRLKKRASIEKRYLIQLTQTQEQLDYLLHHDPLTSLPNQLSLREIFNTIISQINISLSLSENSNSENPSQFIPILTLGLDRFRRINESFGYNLGDLVLKIAAQYLSQCINNQGSLARLNGDEFAILLKATQDKEIVANYAQKLLKLFSQPLLINEQEIFLSLSIGISFYPEDGSTLETLLQKANSAMKRAKYLGGDRYEFYPKCYQKIPSPDYLELEADLRHALERNELEVHYQPRLSLSSGEIVGAEALTRWYHPRRGLVSPGIFIPIAEETGLIEPIGEWVLRTACEQSKIWQEKGLGLIRVAVNLSGRQFNQLNLSQWVAKILRETKINSHLLELELTESILVENASESIQKLNDLKTLGVKIAIDDFGTGYSSLSYLQQFPFDILKIDRCFVRNIDQNSKNAAITQAIIFLAHQLGLTVVAEGIETKSELSFLQNHQCDEMQGYLFSRSVKASEFEHLVQSRKNLLKLK
ncbi:response regulator receiver modulated diguanylate cyclase/phosphodiesterase [Gloeothece citriformis PCC 7424]|uniref:Response regulator receiver modulated diguanylate cyclase/phosphodiesterase n=1 Tax=Gloeothece citriformis (strain PCC 7424) TaxID=65393 RepID=B7KEZ6_GLOC7|nr:GGDEF domain-containing response regulator [Gloeothece citriformis]ACK70452.1 response regulator receiver modulated diguanylate cyclase/phosphodiesterase [Gloeothece citriformis PCC 7424]